MLEMDLKAKEREIKHKDEIIDIKDKESKKGWSLLKIIHPKKNLELKGIESRSIAIKILENLAISFTISGVRWGIIYALLSEKKYPTAMRESLIIAGIFFIFIFIIYLIKKDNLAFIIQHQSSFVYTIAFVPVLFDIYQTTMSDAFPYAPPCGCLVFELPTTEFAYKAIYLRLYRSICVYYLTAATF